MYVSIYGKGHFFTLVQDHLHMIFKTFFSQTPLGHFNQILNVSFQVQGNENLLTWCWSHDQDGRKSRN